MGMFEEELFGRSAEGLTQDEKISIFFQLTNRCSQVVRVNFSVELTDGLYFGLASGWSRSDVKLLDLMLEECPKVKLVIFDFTEFTSKEMVHTVFHSVVPNQTPIYAKRLDGKWVFVRYGFDAREAIKLDFF